MNREAYSVTFEATGPGVETILRVRRMLKISLRSFGLRCVAIAPATPQDATEGHGPTTGTSKPSDAPPCEPRA